MARKVTQALNRFKSYRGNVIAGELKKRMTTHDKKAAKCGVILTRCDLSEVRK